MHNRRTRLAALAVLVLAGAAAAYVAFGAASWRSLPAVNLSPLEFRDLLAAGNVTLVNVHVPYEGRIGGEQLQIPYDRLGQFAEQLPPDRTARLAVYCMSGRMSEIAVRELAAMGYSNIFHLNGGMLAWAAAGLPLDDWRR